MIFMIRDIKKYWNFTSSNYQRTFTIRKLIEFLKKMVYLFLV